MKKLFTIILLITLILASGLSGCSSLSYKEQGEPERHIGHPGHEYH